MPSLDARVAALEKTSTPMFAVVDIIRLVGMSTDGSEPDPVSRATVNGKTLLRQAAETQEDFFARVRAEKPLQAIALAF